MGRWCARAPSKKDRQGVDRKRDNRDVSVISGDAVEAGPLCASKNCLPGLGPHDAVISIRHPALNSTGRKSVGERWRWTGSLTVYHCSQRSWLFSAHSYSWTPVVTRVDRTCAAGSVFCRWSGYFRYSSLCPALSPVSWKQLPICDMNSWPRAGLCLW